MATNSCLVPPNYCTGSAVFKSIAPALISSLVYLLLFHVTDLETEEGEIFDVSFIVAPTIYDTFGQQSTNTSLSNSTHTQSVCLLVH